MQDLKNELQGVIRELYGVSDFVPEVTLAPENIEADYSSNAPLKLAKIIHRSPMEIAEEISGALDASLEIFSPLLARARRYGARSENAPRRRGRARKFQTSVCAPGFLNFISSDEYLWAKIGDLGVNFAENISSYEYSGKTVVCEFSDPNPFKVLHVGHLYTSIVGSAISNLLAADEAHVFNANFGGDVGLHVAKTMYVLRQKDPGDLKIDDIAKCYIEGTAIYDADEKARAEITELNKEIYRINSENDHSTPLARLYWRGRELSYAYFEDFYDKIGVFFDKYYPESAVASLGKRIVEEQLAAGVYEKSDGAVVFNGEPYELHTRVFINREGVPTYEAKDVGLLFQKDKDYHFDKSIVITGSEQRDYMKVVLKSVEQYAPELVEKTVHLTHGLVKLPGNVKMSSRKGNFLKAVDVLELVNEELEKQHDGYANPEIADAALKYSFLKYRLGSDIIFDPKESVSMTGNSGPYILYSVVRAKKILKHVGAEKNAGELALEHPLNAHDRDLIKKILGYGEVFRVAVDEFAPHKLANYLYELAQAFSRFYEHCPVFGAPEEKQRTCILYLYVRIMEAALGILGIKNIPEEM